MVSPDPEGPGWAEDVFELLSWPLCLSSVVCVDDKLMDSCSLMMFSRGNVELGENSSISSTVLWTVKTKAFCYVCATRRDLALVAILPDKQ